MMMPAPIMQVLVTMALMGALTLSPINQLTQVEAAPWEPAETDVVALARTLYGECRGCSELQQRAVAWTIFNRVDDPRFPDSLIEVVSQPYQFAGYSESFPVTEDLAALAWDCLTDWHFERERVLEPEFCFFFGNGRINIFSTEYGGKGERWAEE